MERSSANAVLHRSAAAMLVALCAAPAAAQGPPTYHVQADSVRFAIDNPFRMYWLKGTDTLGAPQHEQSVESHVWSGPPETPRLTIHQLVLNVDRRTSDDTFDLAPDGQVLAINHRPPTGDERVDLLLRLPSRPLRPGTHWSDTLESGGTDPGGREWYDVNRDYRVVRLIDTLGVHGVADIRAVGRIRMRFGFWVDSTSDEAAWIDVTGPETERYLFDPKGGRLLFRTWNMDLRGRGVAPNGHSDTLPAGLLSEETMVRDDSPRTEFLLSPLPGTDTSVSVSADGYPILLHTTARGGQRLTASLTRNDGMVGVARLALQDHAVSGFDASWADSTTFQHIGIVVRHDSLEVHRSGRADTSFAIPPHDIWGIADYGMDELLCPILLPAPRDGSARSIAIFRPYPGHWDTDTVVAHTRADGILFTLHSPDGFTQTLFVTSDGDYLFGQDSHNARRVPVDSPRQARLKTIIAHARESQGGG